MLMPPHQASPGRPSNSYTKPLKSLAASNIALRMDYVRCGAKTRRGTPCRSIVVAAGNRCRFHGGWSTGPRTPMGKLRNGLTLKRYRIVATPGYRWKGNSRRRRLARARRLALMPAMNARQERRRRRWAQKQRLRAGLPLLTDAELDAFACDPIDSDQSSE